VNASTVVDHSKMQPQANQAMIYNSPLVSLQMAMSGPQSP